MSMLYKKFTFNPFQENTYVLFDETKEAIIIDPGCYYPNEFKQVDTFIESEGLTLKAIVNTHCHIDHVLGVQEVKDKFSVPFQAHKNESLNLDRLDFQANMFGLPLKSATPEIDQFINEKDIVRFGSTELEILFVPGHSPGHLAFVNHATNTIIGGDVLFRQSIGRTDLPGCNHDHLIESIQEKLFKLNDDYTVLAGHMENTTIGYEKQNNPFVKVV